MTNPTDFEMTDSVKKAMVNHIMGELAPAQRFFMVKVTGCVNCIHADTDGFGSCNKAYWKTKSIAVSYQVFRENEDAITESCPMYPQSQETEK